MAGPDRQGGMADRLSGAEQDHELGQTGRSGTCPGEHAQSGAHTDQHAQRRLSGGESAAAEAVRRSARRSYYPPS
ncbi:Uncharacterised protein [Mycobacteroides abscessus subsp. abscessus]|nr:Uncharacterised protein [Mycobacteroides abscessus subsp. abscessus]